MMEGADLHFAMLERCRFLSEILAPSREQRLELDALSSALAAYYTTLMCGESPSRQEVREGESSLGERAESFLAHGRAWMEERARGWGVGIDPGATDREVAAKLSEAVGSLGIRSQLRVVEAMK